MSLILAQYFANVTFAFENVANSTGHYKKICQSGKVVGAEGTAAKSESSALPTDSRLGIVGAMDGTF